jgi:hypothetical protein
MFSSRRITTLGGSKFQDNYSFEINLDSTNEYIQTSSTYQSVFRGSWSIVAWIKCEDAQTTGQQIIFGGYNTDNEDWIYVGIEENDSGNPGKLRTYYRSNDNADSALTIDLSSTHLADGPGDWIQCIWTLDLNDDEFKFWVNGVNVSPTDSTKNFNSSGVTAGDYTTDVNPHVGSNNDDGGGGGNRFDGKISEFAIYDVALTDGDAMTLYNAREPFDHKDWSKSQNVALWFRMGDAGAITGDDNVIKDLSGNGNNGTQQNIDAGDIEGDTP